MDNFQLNCAFYFIKRPLNVTGANSKYIRIIGGEESNIEQFPYIVAIKRIDTNAIVCAGAIISNKHIITAGHCIFQKERYFSVLRVYASVTDLRDANGSVYNIDRFFVHSDQQIGIMILLFLK
jgi:secreted trypsin-like serine protease